jgi:hypothetical protein
LPVQQNYTGFCSKTWPKPNTPTNCVPSKNVNIYFNKRNMPRGVLPAAACLGTPIEHAKHVTPTNTTKPKPSPPSPPAYHAPKCEWRAWHLRVCICACRRVFLHAWLLEIPV